MKEQRSVVVRGLRIIGSYIAMHPVPFTVAVTGAAVYAAMTVGTTVVLGKITDRVLVPAFDQGVSWRTIAWGAGAIVAVALVKALGIVTRRYFAGMTGARVMASLRGRVVDRYQQLPLAYHQSHPTGELLAHAEADVESAAEILHPLPYTTAVILLLAFAIIALVVTDPFLAVIGLLILPGVTVLNRYFSRRIEGPSQRIQERLGEVSAVAHESIDGALMVKTLGRESAEVERLDDTARRLRDERVVAGYLRALFDPAFEAIPGMGMVVLIAVGTWRISTGAISLGTLVQFVALFQLMAFPMRLIGFILSDIPRAVAGRARLEDVYSEPVAMPSASENLSPPEGPVGVSVREVAFSYPGNQVFERLSFDVEPNESVALVGQTGSGKSTLASLLVRLADPESGSIQVGGVDVRSLSAAHLRRTAAIVFQESFLFATTLWENIALGLDVPEEEIVAAARLAQAEGFITELPRGFNTVVGERGVTLSGGQRQRVAIARALVRKPRILILDDATSAVDPTVEAAILNGLRRDLNTTLIVVAYRVSTVTLAERVLFLDGGRVVGSGTHEELMAHPGYEAMVRAYERSAA